MRIDFKNLLFLILLFNCFLVTSQKEAAIWYFGKNAGLDFNSGSPVVLFDGQLNTIEGCATISDINGSLLFYTDGIKVWNKNHQLMPNGEGLLGNPSSTQSAIIVPKPNDSSIYFIFTCSFQKGINYSEVNISFENGLGDVTKKNEPLLIKTANNKPPSSEKLTAVLHANGTDVWVIGHGWRNDNFFSFRVTSTGVMASPVESNVGIDFSNSTSNFDAHGYLKASPDGRRLAICHEYVGAELLDFNNSSGIVSNPIILSENRTVYGAEFSPSGEVLYIAEEFGDIYQYDLNAPDIRASVLNISGEIGNSGALQLGIDGKIYSTIFSRNKLSVINKPNLLGTDCEFEYEAIDLGSSLGYLGLPPFIQSYFSVAFTSENFCLGDTTNFNLNTSEPVISAYWDFGDGNVSTMENPANSYVSAGTYLVSVAVTTAIETRTETREITIYETPVANTVLAIDVCSVENSYNFDLSIKDSEVLGTQNAGNFIISYHSSQLDAENNKDSFPNTYSNTLENEVIFVRIQNKDNSECYDTTSFELQVKPAPILYPVVDWTVCDTDTDGVYEFDLTDKYPEILNGQDGTKFVISFYETEADALINTNEVAPIYTNSALTQEIFFRLHNSTYNECFETGSFMLEVINSVTANQPKDYYICDDDNDGFQTFDLSTVDVEVVGAQNPSGLSISYHIALVDAENGTNTLNTGYTNTTPYTETIFVRIENTVNTSCYDTTSFQLIVSDTPVTQTVEDWYVCEDNTDGIFDFDLTEKEVEILGTQSNATYSVLFYESQSDAEQNINPINIPYSNISNPQTIFYRVQNVQNISCIVVGNFNIEILNSPIANKPSDMNLCDLEESGKGSFDFSMKDQEVLNGQNSADYQVYYFFNETDAITNENKLPKTGYVNNMPSETIYVRAEHSKLKSCYDITNFSINIITLPLPNLEETYVICPDSPELTIDGGDFETWSWKNVNSMEVSSDRTIDITEIGVYTLTIAQTTNGVICKKTVVFEVVSSGVPEDFTTKIGDPSDNVEIQVSVVGSGEFEYSVDGENFQDSNRLEVFPGVYTVYVRDKYLCRTINKEVIALGFQKFFTPNGDGYNEFWNIIGAELYPASQLFIYDRYGKFITQLSPDSKGWDGRFNGKPLPASDYWFKYQYANDQTMTGHFTLKR